MRSRRLTLLTLASLAVTFPAHASAPDGRKIRPKEVQALRDAAAVTLAAGPRQYSVEVLIFVDAKPPDPGHEYQPFKAEGVIDPATGETVATFGVADPESPDSADANTLDVVAPSNAVTYVSTDDAFELPPGKTAVEVPTDQLPNAQTTTSSLKYLSSFVGTAIFRGSGEDREVKTKTYVVRIPIRTILESGGIPSTPQIERDLRRLERSGQGNAIGNIELDAKRRIHGFAVYVPLDTKGRVELAIQGQYFSYGEALDAVPPPAEQVVPFDQAPAELRTLLGLQAA
jgi:hypothetical protein